MKHRKLTVFALLVMVALAAAPAPAITSDCWLAPLYELSFARPHDGWMLTGAEPGGEVPRQILELAGGLNLGRGAMRRPLQCSTSTTSRAGSCSSMTR